MENPFNDTYFMKKALQEAEMAFEKGEIPVGALIVIPL
jgi:tRNA(adenine34) deaminase